MDTFRCLNCGCESGEGAQVYATVLVCAGCHTLAVRTKERILHQLQQLVLLTDETIRLALVEGRLHAPLADSPEGPPKKEVLEFILKAKELQDARAPSAPR